MFWGRSIKNKYVTASSIGECWVSCINKIMQHGKMHYDEDVPIKEILGLTVEILNPSMDDEIIDEYGDSTIIQHTLDKFAKGSCMPDRPFTYGACIYDKDSVDQYEWLINRLQKKKETKSATFCLISFVKDNFYAGSELLL